MRLLRSIASLYPVRGRDKMATNLQMTFSNAISCTKKSSNIGLENYLVRNHILFTQSLYSLSGKTSYRKISWSLEAARFGFKLFQSLWNLTGTSAALQPRCLSNFRAIRPLQHPISWLRDFTRFGGKTSYRLVNRGPLSRMAKHVARVYFMWCWDKHDRTLNTDVKCFTPFDTNLLSLNTFGSVLFIDKGVGC